MGVVITARRDGFRRAGIAHSAQGTYYPDGRLTEEQLQALRDEPQLVVIEGVEDPQEQGNANVFQAGESTGAPGQAPSAPAVSAEAPAAVFPPVAVPAKRSGRQPKAQPAAVTPPAQPPALEQRKHQDSEAPAKDPAEEDGKPNNSQEDEEE